MKQLRSHSPQRTALFEKRLLQAILALRTEREARDFFRDLCSPAELEAMADRWAVVEELQRGLAYRAIQQKTGVSVTTIGRVARCLALGKGGYGTVAERIGANTGERVGAKKEA